MPFEIVDAFLFRWMSPLAPALAVVVIVARTLTSSRPSTGWLLIAAGQAFWSGGAFYYSIVLWQLDPMPFPSLADASWLAFYPPTLAGVVLLIRARVAGRGDTVSLLDAAIGGLAISAAGAALAFGPIVDATGGSTLAIATNLAFPLADLAIVAVMVGGLAMSGWRLGRCWTLLGAGFVLFAVSDTTYLFQIANGTYTGGLVEAGWVCSCAVVALAVWQPWTVTRVRVQAWSAFVFPAAFGAIGLSVLVYATFRQVHLLALVLATACVVAVIGRMSLIFQQNLRMIRASGIEASTDALTGLGNRRQLLADLAAVQRDRGHARAARPGRLQDLQRHLRTPGRRRTARPARPAAGSDGRGRRCGLQTRRRRVLRPRPGRRPRPGTRPHRLRRALRARRRLRDHKLLRVRDDAQRRPGRRRGAPNRRPTDVHPKARPGKLRRPPEQKRPPQRARRTKPGTRPPPHRRRRARSRRRPPARAPGTRDRTGPPRRRTPRRRQSRNPRRDPAEERPPHRRGVALRARTHPDRRPHHQRRTRALARRETRPLQPRTLGRHRLPRPPQGRRHPDRLPHRLRLRRLRRHGHQPPLPRSRRTPPPPSKNSNAAQAPNSTPPSSPPSRPS